MERETGFEPATPTLARLCSTTELFPHSGKHFKQIVGPRNELRDAIERPYWRRYGRISSD